MSDTRFERERPALEQQPLPVRSRVEVIRAARGSIERMAVRIEKPVQTRKPQLVPLDLVAQVQANEAEPPIRVLTDMAAEKAIANDNQATESEQTVVGELDIDKIRREVEAANV